VDKAKLDEVVLALLWFNQAYAGRAWKGFDWDTMNRLNEQGLISNPKSKAKSVALSEAAEKKGEAAFVKHFGQPG
jgi:hypothetical protein